MTRTACRTAPNKVSPPRLPVVAVTAARWSAYAETDPATYPGQ
ncbi:MAG: hypothetical protein R3E95_18655 [Thiolinea sp.]